MLSQMAKEDYLALLAEGITPSFEQAVTLNALGLLVERGPFSGAVFSAPRTAWAGTVPLFEPTIQSEQWYLEKATEWWTGRSLFWALAWACAHAPRPRCFERCGTRAVAQAAVERWGNGLTCTVAQLNTALDYVIRGRDVPPVASVGAPDAFGEAAPCPNTDLVDDALAAGLGLAPERIAAMTRSRAVSILRKWAANQIALNGGTVDFDKGSKTDAYVKYDDYLISIRSAATNKGAQIYG